jgi:DNA repair protein RadC
MLREEYLLHGPDHMGDVDLIALLLGTGAAGRSTRSIATDLLDTYGNLSTLSATSPQAIARVRGVGVVRALRVHAALQLGRRAQTQTLARSGALTTAEDAASWLAPALHGLKQEELHALYLDRRLRPICRRALTVGNDAHTVVDSRQILKVAVEVGACAFVLAHNHPSGDPEPSQEDLEVTRVVAAAAAVIGVTFLDHLVIGGGRWVSLAQRGMPEVHQAPARLQLMLAAGRRSRTARVAAEP